MKKVIIVLFLSIFSLSINAQTKVEPKKIDPNAPVFEFESKTINYGEIAHNSDGVKTLKFKNIGKSPLIISNVKGSCGCTVPSAPKEPIMPGNEGEIKVKYATNRVGSISKTITIYSNASTPTVTIPVRGKVLKAEANSPIEKKKSLVANPKS